MVPEERRDADAEHDRDKEQEEDVEFSCTLSGKSVCPKQYEILEYTSSQVNAVDEGVSEKQHEKLVVIEGHAVVHPRTVVIHLEDAVSANRAMVAAIGLDGLAFVTISNCTLD